MRALNIFLFEWKHFTRSSFKVVAVLLFIVAAIYGINNGYQLYQKQRVEIDNINAKAQKDIQENIIKFDKGELTNPERPWIDISDPYWAIWSTPTPYVKEPSPAMVYSIGQAEQYGFYKQISFWSSPYDVDMAEEISNPERLQFGTLDFAFVLLFLLPLLLMILLYNIKSAESEQAILQLVEVQTASRNSWLLSRMAFYILLTLLVCFGLIVYGGIKTNLLNTTGGALIQMLLYTLLYIGFWSVIYFFILRSGKSIMGNTLQMIGIWLLLAFIIPATLHQLISINKPANLMTDFIEVRDKMDELYDMPDSTLMVQIATIVPELQKIPGFADTSKLAYVKSYGGPALSNFYNKESTKSIIEESADKNNIINKSYWFNPVGFFQNQLNQVAKTHYNDYSAFRNDIQKSIDKRIEIMLVDIWNEVEVDKAKYLNYKEVFSQNPDKEE